MKFRVLRMCNLACLRSSCFNVDDKGGCFCKEVRDSRYFAIFIEKKHYQVSGCFEIARDLLNSLQR